MALAQIRVLFENMPCVSYCSGLQFSNPNPTAFDFLCTKALFIRWDTDCLLFAKLSRIIWTLLLPMVSILASEICLVVGSVATSQGCCLTQMGWYLSQRFRLKVLVSEQRPINCLGGMSGNKDCSFELDVSASFADVQFCFVFKKLFEMLFLINSGMLSN